MIETVQGDIFREKVKSSEIPVLVDFHAQWSGPCKAMETILIPLAENFNTGLKIIKLNIEDNPDIVDEYNIKAFPTLLLMKDGRILERLIGLADQKEIMAILEKNHIGKKSQE